MERQRRRELREFASGALRGGDTRDAGAREGGDELVDGERFCRIVETRSARSSRRASALLRPLVMMTGPGNECGRA